MSRRSAGAAGFTLVEVVVALAVLSLIMLSTIAALRTFGNTQRTLETQISRVEEVRSVSDFLRNALASSVVGSSSDGLGFGATSNANTSFFRGAGNAFVWKAYMLFGENYGGAFLVRLSLQGDELLLQWQDPPDQPAEAKWADTPSRVLVAGVESLDLAYRKLGQEEWQPQWTRQEAPDAVRVNLRKAGRYWPELILQVLR